MTQFPPSRCGQVLGESASNAALDAPRGDAPRAAGARCAPARRGCSQGKAPRGGAATNAPSGGGERPEVAQRPVDIHSGNCHCLGTRGLQRRAKRLDTSDPRSRTSANHWLTQPVMEAPIWRSPRTSIAAATAMMAVRGALVRRSYRDGAAASEQVRWRWRGRARGDDVRKTGRESAAVHARMACAGTEVPGKGAVCVVPRSGTLSPWNLCHRSALPCWSRFSGIRCRCRPSSRPRPPQVPPRLSRLSPPGALCGSPSPRLVVAHLQVGLRRIFEEGEQPPPCAAAEMSPDVQGAGKDDEAKTSDTHPAARTPRPPSPPDSSYAGTGVKASRSNLLARAPHGAPGALMAAAPPRPHTQLRHPGGRH